MRLLVSLVCDRTSSETRFAALSMSLSHVSFGMLGSTKYWVSMRSSRAFPIRLSTNVRLISLLKGGSQAIASMSA